MDAGFTQRRWPFVIPPSLRWTLCSKTSLSGKFFTADERQFDVEPSRFFLGSQIDANAGAIEIPEPAMQKHQSEKNAKTPIRSIPTRIADSGKVRLGWTSPGLPPVKTIPKSVEDTRKVRLGWTSPSLPPVRATPKSVADTRKVRLGWTSPSLPPVKATPKSVADTRKVRLGWTSPSF